MLAAATGFPGITASYSSASQTLVLTGTDTLSHYQAVLDSVTFWVRAEPGPLRLEPDPHPDLAGR